MKNETIIIKIIDYAEKVIKYCEDITVQRDFESNIILVEACVFNFSQIGELANKIDTSFTNKYADIPWRAVYGLRNRIVHDYEGVNLSLIWDIIKNDLPELIIKLKSLT